VIVIPKDLLDKPLKPDNAGQKVVSAAEERAEVRG
jgi:hypothetical protein